MQSVGETFVRVTTPSHCCGRGRHTTLTKYIHSGGRLICNKTIPLCSPVITFVITLATALLCVLFSLRASSSTLLLFWQLFSARFVCGGGKSTLLAYKNLMMRHTFRTNSLLALQKEKSEISGLLMCGEVRWGAGKCFHSRELLVPESGFIRFLSNSHDQVRWSFFWRYQNYLLGSNRNHQKCSGIFFIWAGKHFFATQIQK